MIHAKKFTLNIKHTGLWHVDLNIFKWYPSFFASETQPLWWHLRSFLLFILRITLFSMHQGHMCGIWLLNINTWMPEVNLILRNVIRFYKPRHAIKVLITGLAFGVLLDIENMQLSILKAVFCLKYWFRPHKFLIMAIFL